MRPQLEQDIGEANDADYSNPIRISADTLLNHLIWSYGSDSMIGLDEIELFFQSKAKEAQQ